MTAPVVLPYQRALDAFRREGSEPPLLKRMSELISLLDLTTTLGAGLPGGEILDAALLTLMGELQTTRGALLIRGPDGRFRVTASRGLASGATPEVAANADGVGLAGEGVLDAALRPLGLELVCAVEKAGRPIALLGVGPRADGRKYQDDDVVFLRSVAACAASPIENGLFHQELETLNRKLGLKVFQLRNLFEISRELTTSLDDEAIGNLVTASLMGQLAASRCALYLLDAAGLQVAHGRGLRPEDRTREPLPASVLSILDAHEQPVEVAELSSGVLQERLAASRMALVVPLRFGGRLEGLVAIGAPVSGRAFSEEDREFAHTLARQAAAALESVRLHRTRLEKQRQDRDLQIAREIQQSLFPARCPAIPGFGIAAATRSSQQVGGDYYDVIPLREGRFAVAVADVSGKGTPASLLMASVHASLRALAGTRAPAGLAERLNAFLFESTQAHKYVTLFYGELDPSGGELVYVNAGHVPPFLRRRSAERGRLGIGGPALGLLGDAAYEEGRLRLESGDLLAIVTDGATEAQSPREEEFGDSGVFDALDGAREGSAEGLLDGLMRGVDVWTGTAGCGDDLTVLVLRCL